MRGLRVLVVLAAPAAPAGCVLFTGSTDGYHLADAGVEGGACEGGAPCAIPSLQCVSAADCTGDAGPAVCCLTLTTMSSAGSACGPQPCAGSPSVQLCKTDAECGSETCVVQSCAFGGATATIQACGSVLLCSAL